MRSPVTKQSQQSNVAKLRDMHEKMLSEYANKSKGQRSKMGLPKSFKARNSSDLLVSSESIDLVIANGVSSSRKTDEGYQGTTEIGPFRSGSPHSTMKSH